MRWTSTEAELRQLLDAAQPSQSTPLPGERFDHGILLRLAEVFDCVSVTYQVSEPFAERFEHVISAEGGSIVDETQTDPDWERFYWPAHWESLSCCYPETTGDHESVTLGQDFTTDLDYRNSFMGEMCDFMEVMLVPLPWAGELDRRLLLWRTAGDRFDEADRLKLTLLRPHLVRVLQAHDHAAKGLPPLTPRERELMVLVADGLTNRQIGRALGISEGTVRKHLEHVYSRLGVSNRVSALALVETSS